MSTKEQRTTPTFLRPSTSSLTLSRLILPLWCRATAQQLMTSSRPWHTTCWYLFVFSIWRELCTETLSPTISWSTLTVRCPFAILVGLELFPFQMNFKLKVKWKEKRPWTFAQDTIGLLKLFLDTRTTVSHRTSGATDASLLSYLSITCWINNMNKLQTKTPMSSHCSKANLATPSLQFPKKRRKTTTVWSPKRTNWWWSWGLWLSLRIKYVRLIPRARPTTNKKQAPLQVNWVLSHSKVFLREHRKTLFNSYRIALR